MTKGNPRHLYLDCKVDTIDRAHPWDYYMVHNDLWQVAGIGANMLCLGCFAQRALSIRLGFTDLDYCGVALWATPSIEPQQLAQLARTPADAVLLE